MDDLVKRLRWVAGAPLADWSRECVLEAADRIEKLEAAVIALADGADKCSEPPHYIVQPFLNVYRAHGETIASARATLSDNRGVTK